MTVKILSEVEQKAEQFWRDLSGAARKDLQEALADAKTDLEKLAPLLQEADSEIKQAIVNAEPAIQSAVIAALVKLLAGAGQVLGTDLSKPADPPPSAA